MQSFSNIRQYPGNLSTWSQRCYYGYMTSRRWTMSNHRWNDVVYVNVEIYNVEQRPINVVYFSIDINKVRQRKNNDVIFNFEFHNVD